MIGQADNGVPDAYSLAVDEVALRLETDLRQGLTAEEAAERLTLIGPNAIEHATHVRYPVIALRQLLDPLVALLVVAAVISFLIGERVEAYAIGAIVLLNGLLGFYQEANAERAILALSQALHPVAAVIRDGEESELPTEEIVPGDLIALRDGYRVPADARLAEVRGMAVDESALTGESVPDDKTVEPQPAGTVLAERTSQVYAGTAVTRGEGHALVTATGAQAEIGQLASMAHSAKPPPTPLQLRLRGLTRVMVAVGLLITASLASIEWLHGSSAEQAFLLGVSVAVAAVPEGLTATVTIALALGARRMAARGALVRRLQAVETLGSASVICSDKTGTLTENRMRLERVQPVGGHPRDEVLRAAALASSARLASEGEGWRAVGDPLDAALLIAAREAGALGELGELEREPTLTIPFDAERKRMTNLYQEDGGARAFVKGAPETVLARCGLDFAERDRLDRLTVDWAGAGLRVLAIACRDLPPESLDSPEPGAIEVDLDLVGLVALQDPLRAGARAAISQARGAGLRIEVLTGDHPATARAIAAQLGLGDEAVAARVTPRDKLQLVERLQARGEVVAVTGDGVNDAPALRKADVGVSMGRSGTEAAREASDVVLTDDDFATIVAAVREGRAITTNVRRFVAFLLSANFGEVLLFGVAVTSGLGAPMSVTQVLLVNVLTDGLPAVALSRDPAAPDVMQRPPERQRRLFGRAAWLALALVGVLVGVVALAAFLIGRADGDAVGRTMAFATIALSELAVVFAVRSPIDPAWRIGNNSYLIGGVVLSIVLLALGIYWTPLQEPLGTVSLDGDQLLVVAALSALPLTVVELVKAALRRFAPARAELALLPSGRQRPPEG